MPGTSSINYYYYWLDIPPEDQPPTHYRLLGLDVFESDPNAIAEAADQRVAHIRTYLNGPHWETSHKLLGELAAARQCLLNPLAKQQYDEQLRQASCLQDSTPPVIGDYEPGNETYSGGYSVVDTPFPPRRPAKRRRSQQGPSVALVLLMMGAVIVLILVLLRITEVSTPAPTGKNSPEEQDPPGTPTTFLPEPIKQALPAVVKLTIIDRDGKPKTLGSGVIISEEGLILTNYHVVAGASDVWIDVGRNQRHQLKAAGFVAIDPGRDLIVVQATLIQTLASLVDVEMADALPQIGEPVWAVGSPAGLPFSVTEGNVSAIRTGSELRDAVPGGVYGGMGFDDDVTWIQHTAPISHGSSGGPLLNGKGELLAVNTWTMPNAQNLNFAVGIEDIKRLLKEAEDELPQDFSALPNTGRDERQPPPKQDAPPPSQERPRPPRQSAPASPVAKEAPQAEKFASLFAPFPSGNTYSPTIFDVDFGPIESALQQGKAPTAVLKYPSGNLHAIVSHVRGQLHGMAIGKYANGKPMVLANYYKGKRHGLMETWTEAGAPLLFSQYRMGRRHGFTSIFSDDGNAMLVIEYKADEPKCIRLCMGSQVHGQFLSRGDADADPAARDLLAKLGNADHALDESEILLRKQVHAVDEQQRKKLASLVTAEIRARAIAEAAAQRAADEAAALRSLQETQKFMTTPSRMITTEIKTK